MKKRLLLSGIVTAASALLIMSAPLQAEILPDNTLDVGEGFSDVTASGEAKPYISAVAEFENGDLLVATVNVSKYKGKKITSLTRIDSTGKRVKGFKTKIAAPDRNFNPAISFMYIHKVGAEEKILITGYFGKVNGVTRNGLALLNNDGSVVESFDPGSGPIDDDMDENIFFDSAHYVNGRYIIPNGFADRFNGQPVGRVLVLDSAGAVVNGFPAFPDDIDSTRGSAGSVIPDGTGFLLQGVFIGAGSNNQAADLIRFNDDGTVDGSFDYRGLFASYAANSFTSLNSNVAVTSTSYIFSTATDDGRPVLVRFARNGSIVSVTPVEVPQRGSGAAGYVFFDPEDLNSDFLASVSGGFSRKPLIRRYNSSGTIETTLKLGRLYNRQNDFYGNLTERGGNIVFFGNFARKAGRKKYHTLLRILPSP